MPLVKYPFEVVCDKSHSFAKIKAPRLRDVLKQPLILAAEDSSSRMQFDHLVAKAGLSDRANIIMTAGNVPSILNYVTLGMGVAVLTRPATEALPLARRCQGPLPIPRCLPVLGPRPSRPPPPQRPL
jgi:DNA-binding transcriptional LysR family regulator